jgi:hypothetical protein
LLFIKEEKNTKMYNHDQIQFLVQWRMSRCITTSCVCITPGNRNTTDCSENGHEIRTTVNLNCWLQETKQPN